MPNLFLNKFESKSNDELEHIAQDEDQTYVYEARQAAAEILKRRDLDTNAIEQVHSEQLKREKNKKEQAVKSIFNTSNLIKNLNRIPIRGSIERRLKNGNKLHVKRLNKHKYIVKIEAFRSELAPILICKIVDDSRILTYPFINFKGLIGVGFGGTILILILSFFNQLNFSWELSFMSFPVALGFQILLSPLYFVILKFLKETLGK